MITHKDLVLNRILYTKDGSRMGNAIVTKVNGIRHSPMSVLMGATSYDLLSDYGNQVASANLNQINNQFNLGPIAKPDHKHYTKPKVVALDWRELVDFIVTSTNRVPGSLDSMEASALISQAWDKYAASNVLRESKPAWRQGVEVRDTTGPGEGFITRSQPYMKGDPKDYLG